jgi:hypothetical protein
MDVPKSWYLSGSDFAIALALKKVREEFFMIMRSRVCLRKIIESLSCL